MVGATCPQMACSWNLHTFTLINDFIIKLFTKSRKNYKIVFRIEHIVWLKFYRNSKSIWSRVLGQQMSPKWVEKCLTGFEGLGCHVVVLVELVVLAPEKLKMDTVFKKLCVACWLGSKCRVPVYGRAVPTCRYMACTGTHRHMCRQLDNVLWVSADTSILEGIIK